MHCNSSRHYARIVRIGLLVRPILLILLSLLMVAPPAKSQPSASASADKAWIRVVGPAAAGEMMGIPCG